jgi:LmbE family N-acetylglucosaminyl deacetylase
MRLFRPLIALVLAAALGVLSDNAAGVQVRATYDLGAAGLLQVLQRLQTTASVLHIGAHPDDEDSPFVTRASRGDHARTGYLSLTRGEGGQNIIGPELLDALGVIRTEELIQAKKLYGAEQFFTRLFDFGFSKTLQESAARWNEREALADVVRVIRTFRPLVVYSEWSATEASGHGHHQFAGYLTPLAVRAAADPDQFPEQIQEGLRAWQTLKIYDRVDDEGTAATLRVPTGEFDPVLGRSYAEIAIEGRSLHRTQQTGDLETRGPVMSFLRLTERRIVTPNVERSVFDGIDTSIPGLVRLAGLPDGFLRPQLAAIETTVKRALDDYDPRNPARIVSALAAGIRATREAREALKAVGSVAAQAEADFLLSFKEQDLVDALARAAGVVVDPLADRETVLPGGTLRVSVRTFIPDSSAARIVDVALLAPGEWSVEPEVEQIRMGQSRFADFEVPTHDTSFRVIAPETARPTQPYWLTAPRTGDMYRWDDDAPKALPFASALLEARVTMNIGGVSIVLSRPVEYRFADGIRGELRREINVVPRVAISLEPSLLVIPLRTIPTEHSIRANVTTFSPDATSGTLRLRLPQGWSSVPAQASFTVREAGELSSASFVVTTPPQDGGGTLQIAVEAIVDGQVFTDEVQIVTYPHIRPHRLYRPAIATALVTDVRTVPIKVGYIMGGGDQVADALRRLGLDVTLIDDETLARGDLSVFDTILVGIRASETRPAFVAANGRLVEYMERAGTLIVQYQRTDYVRNNLPPFPATSPDNSRVTDETAPVKILAPTHPVFTFPNTITEDDFNGWVQERNLYAFNAYDPRYTPLLETADPGEAPQLGGQLYAEVGKGHYIYTAYAWFRQLPAGVPGAYRQFVNLVSLSKAPR